MKSDLFLVLVKKEVREDLARWYTSRKTREGLRDTTGSGQPDHMKEDVTRVVLSLTDGVGGLVSRDGFWVVTFREVDVCRWTVPPIFVRCVFDIFYKKDKVVRGVCEYLIKTLRSFIRDSKVKSKKKTSWETWVWHWSVYNLEYFYIFRKKPYGKTQDLFPNLKVQTKRLIMSNGFTNGLRGVI